MGYISYGWNISRVENFVQFKIVSYLENFAGSNSTLIFVSSATHEKREIKNTSKCSTRTVISSTYMYARERGGAAKRPIYG